MSAQGDLVAAGAGAGGATGQVGPGAALTAAKNTPLTSLMLSAPGYELAQPMPMAAIERGERRLRWLGLVVIVAVFGGLGTWGALAPLNSAAVGSGVIAVENYRKTVQHLEGGIVKSIAVRDGDVVRKDQALLTLDDTQPRAQLEVLRGQSLMNQAKEARLVAERDRRALISYPGALVGALAGARADARTDARARDAMRIQDQTFFARRTAMQGEAALYERQISQLQAKLQGLDAQRTSRDHLATSYQRELVDYRALLEEGYTDRLRVRELERSVVQTEGQRGALVSEQAATEQQISETRVKLLQIQNEFQREVARELSQVQSELFDQQAKLQALEDAVARTIIRAPDAGTVLDLSVHTIGAVLRPGGKLLDLVPQNEKLLVQAQLSPRDIDQVRVGQFAEVRFSAFKQRDTARIDGKLVSLSADRLIDESSSGKLPYYLARVEITPEGLKELARGKLALLPGMPVEVLIKTGERTALSYLLAPLRDSLARGFTEH